MNRSRYPPARRPGIRGPSRSEVDRAFDCLGKAVQYHDPSIGTIAVYLMFANLHQDPRWLPFLRKSGMAPEQLTAIMFDVNVPQWRPAAQPNCCRHSWSFARLS
jgi:hypothetical protein